MMNHRASMRLLRLLSGVILLSVLGGCRDTPKAATSREKKLDLVVNDAARVAAPDDRAAFAQAAPFTNVQGLEVTVIGFRVPLDDGKRRVLISFTHEHFDATGVEQLAAEAVADYVRVKNAPSGSTTQAVRPG
ncbi:MAG: hypothetical protein ABSH20_13445 [Tepidisphaeraceae bacterium]